MNRLSLSRAGMQVLELIGKAERVMEAPQKTEVESLKVYCDGGKGALGHPRVYLNLGDKGQVECPYCGHLFVLKEGAKISDAH